MNGNVILGVVSMGGQRFNSAVNKNSFHRLNQDTSFWDSFMGPK